MKGRDRRLQTEWETISRRFSGSREINCSPCRVNPSGVPTAYMVRYDIRCICAVTELGAPIWADSFLMRIDIPDGYPCIDAMPSFRFMTRNENGDEIPHPWHPNIRYYGDFAGRVCLNATDSYIALAWAIERIGRYLKYELYHALNEPPYPEDQQVASWVIRIGEPEGWI